MMRYHSHKIVEAGKIQRIHRTHENNVGVIDFVEVGGKQIAVPQDWSARGVPEIGDYLVRYNGGTSQEYLSWSPADVFESGYTLIDDILADDDDVQTDGSCDENGQQA